MREYLNKMFVIGDKIHVSDTKIFKTPGYWQNCRSNIYRNLGLNDYSDCDIPHNFINIIIMC